MEEKISPLMLLSHMLSVSNQTVESLKIGAIVIGSWNYELIKNMAEETGAEPIAFWPNRNKAYNWKVNGHNITLIELPVGAPSAVSTTEMLIACGAKAIIGIGMTGSLQPHIRIGDIVLPLGCLREEGTSYHYIEDDSRILPGTKLSELLDEFLDKEGIKYEKGNIWTTDAIFRELNSKVEQYGKQGILSVEMETSAMYAVGKFRGVEICNLLAVSDELFGEWNPQLVGSVRLKASLEKIKELLYKNIDQLLSEFSYELDGIV